VFPGSYRVVASLRGTPAMAASMPVEVSERSVGVTLQLRPAADIRGRVEIDSGPQQTDPQQPLTQINIHLISPFGYMQGYNQRPAEPDASGSFVLKSVLPVPARINVWGGMYYVKSISYGGAASDDGLIDFSAGSGELRIRLGPRTAELSGHAEPGSNIWISRIEERPFAREGTLTITAGPQGNFRMGGLAPGRYRVAAGPMGGSAPPGGQEITISEGEAATLDVKAAP
jgi:hypothetical protein